MDILPPALGGGGIGPLAVLRSAFLASLPADLWTADHLSVGECERRNAPDARRARRDVGICGGDGSYRVGLVFSRSAPCASTTSLPRLWHYS